MFTIILYVTIIILCTDLGMLSVSKINIDKDNKTAQIRGDYCYNVYLIRYYKSKHAHVLCIEFLVTLHSIPDDLGWFLIA